MSKVMPAPYFNHTCHWSHCRQQVPAARWGCLRHWFTLPKELRDQIWRTYRPGQETDKRPSPAYIAAAKAAQDWISEFGISYPELVR